MAKKLTISVDSEAYAGLHRVIGRWRSRGFLNDLTRPHVLGDDLVDGYTAMAADEARERDACFWWGIAHERSETGPARRGLARRSGETPTRAGQP